MGLCEVAQIQIDKALIWNIFFGSKILEIGDGIFIKPDGNTFRTGLLFIADNRLEMKAKDAFCNN